MPPRKQRPKTHLKRWPKKPRPVVSDKGPRTAKPERIDVGYDWDALAAIPESDHPYNKRNIKVKLKEERAYNVGFAKLCFDRGYFNLCLSHLNAADELKEISTVLEKVY